MVNIKKLYPKVKFSSFFLSRRKGYTINDYVGRCQAARTTVSLKPNGTISLPCLLHTAANSDNAPLREFWRSDEAKQTREKCGRYGFCEKCDVICMYEASLIGHPIQIARWLSEMWDLNSSMNGALSPRLVGTHVGWIGRIIPNEIEKVKKQFASKLNRKKEVRPIR